MYNNIGILILELFALGLYLLGYFQVKTTFDDVNLIQSSNNNTMKVIFLLVDALRIDLFVNKNFSFYQEMKQNQYDYQILYYGISSAPTATQINLQAITTGNFPAFIDFSQNMNAKSLKEDNIIYSMKRSNKKIALLGDDTWLNMFPTQFDLKKSVASFDVRDLDGADNLVFNNILNLMDQEYDFIVGHLLGIDHSGHSYNDSNFALWNKQKQYNQLFYQIYDKLDNNTMLFIVGDHGMSADGNHGGRSTKEISSTIYAINKKYKFNRQMFSQTFNNKQYTDDLLINRQEFIRQGYNINLASTIAYLMGISIPFSNIGSMFSEIINSPYAQELGCQENLNQIIQYLNKFEKYENYYYNIKQSNNLNCQDIQQIIIDLQIDIKTKFKLYDYFYLIIAITLLITIFFVHLIVISDTQLSEALKNQNKYLIYRLEILYFLLPSLGLLLIFFSFNIAIKTFSIYILLLVLKNLFHSLFSVNAFIEVLNFLDLSSDKKRLYFIILNIFVQKAVQELSGNREIITTTNIFGIIFNILIMLLISQSNVLKFVYFPIFSLILLILAEQYNPKFVVNYPKSPFVMEILSTFFQSFWIKYFIPAIFLQILFFKIYDKKLYSILLLIAQILQIYNNSQINFDDLFLDHLWIIKRGLPLFLYFSSLIFLIKYRDLIYVFLIILTVSGENGMISYCCLFYTIYFLIHFYNKIPQSWTPIILGATIQLLLNYFWYLLGHRMSFDNVKFKDALIGFESYNIIYNNILLTLSIFGIFFIKDVIEKIVNSEINSKKYKNQVIVTIILFQFYQLVFTCFENSINLYHQNIDQFAQKIIYESFMFMFLLLDYIISEGLQHLNSRIRESLGGDVNNYDTFENEVLEN